MWPDGTWCLWEDRHEYLLWMSDDYERLSAIFSSKGEIVETIRL